jgi:hypothetical protein
MNKKTRLFQNTDNYNICNFTNLNWLWILSYRITITRSRLILSLYNLFYKLLPSSTQLRATWHTDSIDMVVLPPTGASRYHNCCIAGGTSLENFGYHLLQCVASSNFSFLWLDDGLVIKAETCCHLITLNKINIYNTSCVLTYKSFIPYL